MEIFKIIHSQKQEKIILVEKLYHAMDVKTNT